MPHAATSCPRCHAALVTNVYVESWCPACQWNLDHYDPGRRHGRDFPGRRSDRWAFRTAFRLNRAQFDALVGRAMDRPVAVAARATFLALSLILLVAVLGVLGLGVYLVAADFGSFG